MVKKNKKGISLIELILYIGLLIIILSGVSSFFIVISNARIRNQVIMEVEQQGTQIMQEIGKSIRNSKKVNAPTVGNSDDSLSLQTVESNNNPTNFYIDNSKLVIKEGNDSSVELMNDKVNISDLNFENRSTTDTLDSVSFSFVLSYNNPGGRAEYNYSKTFYSSDSTR